MKFVFLGPPGAGKGTVAAKASGFFHAPHISTGDVFRNAIAAGSPLGLKAKDVIEKGLLVDDETTVSLVRERLEADDVKDSYILDGFPRTLPQAEALDGFAKTEWTIYFDVPDSVVIARLSGRLICRRCGCIWHKTYNPPTKEGVCDKCGGELYERGDDKPDAIRERLAAYNELTVPLIEYYRKKGLLAVIDTNRDVSLILEDMKKRCCP
ncbi:MAG: adenylate kinase [Spirochaetaceae bacterium]|jgi:adenylate kinase|nr:adenylate kinase [Spirochaetaceae bacterium]